MFESWRLGRVFGFPVEIDDYDLRRPQPMPGLGLNENDCVARSRPTANRLIRGSARTL
jgi:hypothetical protein